VQIKVDFEVCETHGLCAMLAPDVFELDADRKLIFQAEPDESLATQVEEAVSACPVQAIVISSPK
jgi:ferredoxin